jgi:protein-S-isoprenylcysteine O-methyltransferase Ste14
MKIFPELQIGVLNGWIPLLLYFIGLILSVVLYSKESRLWLFNNPKDESKRVLVFIRICGQLVMIAYIVMMIFTPLHFNNPIFIAGALIYAIGYIYEISALHYFRITPLRQPVVGGPYRVSRNPQWLGLFLVLLGSAIATQIWLYIGMVIIVAFIYHIQILDEEAACIEKYGDSYYEYKKRIPRYFLFL